MNSKFPTVDHRSLIGELDEREAGPAEICWALGLDPKKWTEAWTAANLYWKNGGKRFSPGEFIGTLAPPTPLAVKDAWVKMIDWGARQK